MALPIIPIALATTAVAIVRNIRVTPVIQDVEDSLDTVEDGLGLNRAADRDQVNAAGRWRRVVRFGANGPGMEIDAAFLGRIRIRKV